MATYKAILIAVLLSTFVTSACKVSPRTLQKWSNRPGSEELFVTWMLDPESSAEVRAKAVEMLVEQYDFEGAQYLPRVADLPQDQRDRAILDAIPWITKLYEGQEYVLGDKDDAFLAPVKVRDAVFILLDTTETEETRAALVGLIVRWLQEHYDACVLSSGRHTAADVLSTVGPERGLEIVTQKIEAGSFEDIVCQSSSLVDVAWLPSVADQISEAYIRRWEDRPPEDLDLQLVMIDSMLLVPESRSLKTWVFMNHLANNDSEIMRISPDAIMAFMEYVRPLSSADDIAYFETMLRIREGNLRWMAFEDIIRLGGSTGLNRALDAIPDAGIWSRWAGEIREDGLQRAATYLCGRPIRDIVDEARRIFEAHIETQNLVARAISIRCLAEIGNERTIELLQSQANNTTSIVPAWGSEEESTVAALVAYATDRIQNPPPPAPEEPPAEQEVTEGPPAEREVPEE